MIKDKRTMGHKRQRERGVSLFLMTAGMLGMLGMCGLGIDLASFYVVRSEAQRAADAAALAGAKIFVLSGCPANTTISCASSTIESAARKEAETVGNQNMVGNQSPGIVDADISFNMSYPGDPIITVNVQRTVAHGNPVPTYFAKILKFSTVNVAVTASAEAYNQAGQGTGGPMVSLTCVKPFMISNCDTARVVSGSNANANKNCPDGSGYDSYFVNPDSGELVNPGQYPSGATGEPFVMQYKSGPGNYQVVDIGQGGGNTELASSIETCYPTSFSCGGTVTSLGTTSGPVTAGVESLIHQTTDCSTSGGQDTLSFDSGDVPPFLMTAGNNNPDSNLIGKRVSSSDSVITVPMYDGSATSSGASMTITGFMQVFVSYGCHTSTNDVLHVTIMNVAGCPGSSTSGGGNMSGGCNGGNMGGGDSGGGSSGGGSSGGSTTSVNSTSTIPIRLIQNPSGT